MTENHLEFDLVLLGATGFTGQLVARYLAGRYGVNGGLRWALAGRSMEKLAKVASGLEGGTAIPLVLADTDDPASLAGMVRRTRMVATTVGPYSLHGTQLVAACAKAGVDYLDLCGEIPWLRDVIARHHEEARGTGARIMVSCGYDAIPAELGVWLCQKIAREELGQAMPLVKARHRAFVTGGASGGSWASGLAIRDAVSKNPGVISILTNPFALTGEFNGPTQPATNAIYDDPDVGAVRPFVMSAINAAIVHRSNMLMGFPYGREFRYDDMMLADMDGYGAPGFNLSDGSVPEGFVGPRPGEGPPPESLDSGYFETLFIGLAEDGRQIRLAVKGDADPGYGSTAKIFAETAMCLLGSEGGDGGVLTPGAALRSVLVDRLQERAGVTFTREPL